MRSRDLTSATWRRSSRSTPDGGNCVEVASLDTIRAVRDSKNPDGPVLEFTTAQWTAFASGIRTGEFD